MKRVIALIVVVLIAVVLGGVAYAAGEERPAARGKVSRVVDGARDLTGANGELTDKELDTYRPLMLLQCQYAQMAQDRGQKGAEKWMDQELKQAWINKGPVTSTVQQEMWRDGYTCTHADVQALQAQVRREQQIAQWGPPAQLQQDQPGLFGGLFADEVDYKVDKRYEGFWMGITKNLELTVSTTADSSAEVLEMTKAIRADNKGFDVIRVEWEGDKPVGKLDQQTYNAAGTVVILNSKDAVTFFADQYPLGNAYEQAKQDFEQEDGIVFVASEE